MKQYVKVLLLIFFLTFVLCGCSEDTMEVYDQISGRVAFENYMDGKYSTVSVHEDGQNSGQEKKSLKEKYLNFQKTVKKGLPFFILGGIILWIIFIPLFKGVPKIQKTVFWFGLLVIMIPVFLVYGMAFLFTSFA